MAVPNTLHTMRNLRMDRKPGTPKPPNTEPPPKATRRSERPAQRRYNVLLVEGRPHYQELLEFYLDTALHDYAIQFANTEEEAEIALSLSRPDLVLLNSRFVEIGGQTALDFIRRNPTTCQTPVIVLLEEENRELVREIVAHPFVDFVSRPIDKYIFVARVKTALMLFDTLRESEEQKAKIQDQVYELNLLSTVAEQSANSIVVLDSELQFQWANRGYRTLYNISEELYEQQKGRPLRDLNRSHELHDSLRILFETQRPTEFVSHVRSGDSGYKWVKTTLTPIFDRAGNLCNIAAVGTDITNQKLIEDELTIERDDIMAMTEDLKNVIHETQRKNIEIQQRNQEIEREKKLMEQGKKRTEKLLMSVLPFETALQLKSKGEAKPRDYKKATVMFTDFKGFTKACINLSPREVVETVHAYFAVFDDITENRNIEKIKTIGDAYMCAGGIPLRNRSNPIDVVLAGLEIQHFMRHLDQVPGFENIPHWDLRLGIHTGNIIAGVVGKRKIAYDIWGDTVNVASRMETAGEVGRVNISGATYDDIKEFFDCTYRGEIEMKNHGKIDMYFVDRLKPEWSLDDLGVKPNEDFLRKLYEK